MDIFNALLFNKIIKYLFVKLWLHKTQELSSSKAK